MAKSDRFNARREAWGLKRALHREFMNALSHLGIHVHYVGVGSELKHLGEGEPPAVPEGYDTRIVGLEGLLPFFGRVPGLDEEFLRDAFARGDECAANFYEGELVGFGFASRTRARATAQLDVLIPSGFCYHYKDWTLEAHRGKHLTMMRGHVRFNAQPSGVHERSIWHVETHNYLSAFARLCPSSRACAERGPLRLVHAIQATDSLQHAPGKMDRLRAGAQGGSSATTVRHIARGLSATSTAC